MSSSIHKHRWLKQKKKLSRHKNVPNRNVPNWTKKERNVNGRTRTESFKFNKG